MKVFCFYLPQFHEIEENNKWWGKGFTEWTNVKKAQSLYKGHQQPKCPLNDNYYDLMDINTVKWQTELMNQYHVDGMIYYHYYFKGKMLLEKPAENLLQNKDIKQPFFFCWANHSWFRSWEGKKDILLEQVYGTEADWEEHFQYLLPFFKDERYEKRNNKPVFMIFKPGFEEKKALFEYFDKRCKDYGFDGLSLIESCDSVIDPYYSSIVDNTNSCTDFVFLREPSIGLSLYDGKVSFHRIKRFIRKRICKVLKRTFVNEYDGDQLLDYSLKYSKHDDKVINGLFFEWDNTPRHSHRGYVIKPISKSMFMKYMNAHSDNQYIFINAWNEWCEGMIMEPTKENGYKYLEWIKEWKESK